MTVVGGRMSQQQRDQALERMNELIDGADEAGRELTGAETDEVMELEARLSVAERNDPVTTRLRTGGAVSAQQRTQLDNAFTDYLRTGKANADLSQLQNAQGEGTGSTGGYLVPDGFRAKVIDRLKAFGGVAALAETITTSTGNNLQWPTLDDTANVGEIVSEGGTFSAGADLLFGSASLGAWRYAAGGAGSTPIRISVELLQDSMIDVEGLVARKLAERIGRIQAQHLVTGTGVVQPKGIVHGLTGVQPAQNTGLKYDDLLTFIHSVDPAYRENAAWLMNDASLQVIRKMKDAAGDPLWRPSIADMGTVVGGGSLLGYPVHVDQAFPDYVANSPTINWGVFGDIQRGYVIRRVRDVVLAVNPYSRMSFGEVEFSGWSRLDAVPQDTAAYSGLCGKA